LDVLFKDLVGRGEYSVQKGRDGVKSGIIGSVGSKTQGMKRIREDTLL